jgi:hypothetical protein
MSAAEGLVNSLMDTSKVLKITIGKTGAGAEVAAK